MNFNFNNQDFLWMLKTHRFPSLSSFLPSFLSSFLFFLSCSSTVVSISLPPFSLHPTHPYFPHSILLPFGFVHGSFIYIPSQSFPFFPLLSPSPQPSSYSQFVLYFNVSDYVLFACLFCSLGSTYRWDHTLFVFQCLAYFT